jgi:AraC family transcriptional regulator
MTGLLKLGVEIVSQAQGTKLDSPRFVNRGPIELVGLASEFTWERMSDIPQLWDEFAAWMMSVPGLDQRDAFGVSYAPANRAAGFCYMAAIEAAGIDETPDHLDRMSIPANRYAVFPHRGHVTEFSQTIGAIQDGWLPDSGFRVPESGEGSLYLFERYSPEFDPGTGFGGMEVWIPII